MRERFFHGVSKREKKEDDFHGDNDLFLLFLTHIVSGNAKGTRTRERENVFSCSFFLYGSQSRIIRGTIEISKGRYGKRKREKM